MKGKVMKYFAVLLIALSMASCGGGGSTPTGTSGKAGATSGVITLSGDDTSIVGMQLDTGVVGSSLASGLQPDYIIIVDQASSVTFTEPNILTPKLDDPSNGFVLVVTDDSAGSGIMGISMSILVGGTKLDYVCTNPGATFIDCGTGSITLNIPNKTVTFVNTTTENKDTGAILILDGTLTWNDAGGTGNGNTGSGNTGGALTDITGVWKDDSPTTWWSDLGYADEVYVLYNQDGTYFDFDYYVDTPCYRKSSGTYVDLGDGNISLDDEPAYQFSISGDIMTVSYLGNSFTSTKSSLTESDFTPSCD